MVKPFTTNSATRFMFIFDDETLFCTSDLDNFKAAVTHNDIGQLGTGEPLNVLGKDYEITDIGIGHYSWPTNIYEPRQTGILYDCTISITVYLAAL